MTVCAVEPTTTLRLRLRASKTCVRKIDYGLTPLQSEDPSNLMIGGELGYALRFTRRGGIHFFALLPLG